MNKFLSSALALPLLCSSLVACMDEAPAVDKLSIQTVDADHVSGTFNSDGVTLAFDFSRSAAVHMGEYRDADGHELVSSVLDGDQETQSFLDGKLIIAGIVGSSSPEMQGDPKLLTELDKRPELALVGPLKDALAASGVDKDLYSPPKPKALVANAYWGADGYLHLGPGETGQLGTQPFWWPTEVVMKNFGSRCATATFYVGLGISTNVVPAYGYKFVTGYWWGAWLYVKNENAYINWDGYGVCGPSNIGVFARYGG